MFQDYGPQDRSLRAGDADRESVAEFLRDQHLAGRLDIDELQERLEHSYAARTYAQLDAVVADLPVRQPRPRSRKHMPSVALLPMIAVLFLALAVSHGHLVWIVGPLVFWFLVGAGRRHGRWGAI
jgi:hypothetical protein